MASILSLVRPKGRGAESRDCMLTCLLSSFSHPGSLVGFFTSYYVYRETRKILSTYEDPRLVSSPDSGPVDDESLDDVHLTHVVYDADEAAARRTPGAPSRREEARERERQAFLGPDASPRLSGSGSSTPRRGTGYQDKAG